MSFYGAVVKPGKPAPFVPPPEEWALHLSQASLPASVKEGKRVSLLVKDQEGHQFILCTLKAGTTDSVPLDLFFNEYAEVREGLLVREGQALLGSPPRARQRARPPGGGGGAGRCRGPHRRLLLAL